MEESRRRDSLLGCLFGHFDRGILDLRRNSEASSRGNLRTASRRACLRSFSSDARATQARCEAQSKDIRTCTHKRIVVATVCLRCSPPNTQRTRRVDACGLTIRSTGSSGA